MKAWFWGIKLWFGILPKRVKMRDKATEKEFKEFRRLNLKFAEFDKKICSSCEYNHLCHPLESTYRMESILICCRNKELKRTVKKVEEMKKGKPIDYFDFTLADEERIKWEEEVFEEFKNENSTGMP